MKKGFDLNDDDERPRVFLQWKGTDACFDFHCKCGAHCHFDGFFAYAVQCPHCSTIYEMPQILYPREVESHPQVKVLEPDEDFDPAS